MLVSIHSTHARANRGSHRPIQVILGLLVCDSAVAVCQLQSDGGCDGGCGISGEIRVAAEVARYGFQT